MAQSGQPKEGVDMQGASELPGYVKKRVRMPVNEEGGTQRRKRGVHARRHVR